MSLIKANTIKPVTAGTDLSLQGDSGGSAVDCLNITSAGDINFTGNTDAKIKLPSAGGIYESDGSTPVLTESGGVVSLGSGVTGAGRLLQIQYLSTDTAVGAGAGAWGYVFSALYLTITKIAGTNIFLQWSTQVGKGGENAYLTGSKIERATAADFGTDLVTLPASSTISSTVEPGGSSLYTGNTDTHYGSNWGHTTIDTSITATADTFYYRVLFHSTGGTSNVNQDTGIGILYAMEIVA